MSTEVSIQGTRFLINGEPTCPGASFHGVSVEGLLLNARMIQAVFDDENPKTRGRWAYPDTGEWDPDRNTNEFCSMLPEYRARGLLAVTVGLQGGGAIYTPDVYDEYDCSAYAPDGTFREPYFERLSRVLKAADEAGMVVIVNYFYCKQAQRLKNRKTIFSVAERVSDWLLGTGHRNILVDVANEAGEHWGIDAFAPDKVHELIAAVRQVSRDGRRLPAGASTPGGDALPEEEWMREEDFTMPHGNGCSADELRSKLRILMDGEYYRARPRPILINEDSVCIDNLEVAVEEGCSWGFFCQGYGSGYSDTIDWSRRARETSIEKLSGYQTLPVNWGINTQHKQAFFDKLAEITASA